MLASAQLAGGEAKAFASGPLCQPVADPRGNPPNVVGVPALAPAGIVIERMEAVGRRPSGLPERPEQVAEIFGGEIRNNGPRWRMPRPLPILAAGFWWLTERKVLVSPRAHTGLL